MTAACCLLHRRRVFVQLWPPSMAFWWFHTDLSRCDGLPEQEDPAAVLIPEGQGGPGWANPLPWEYLPSKRERAPQ
jgi:hypothetical protein